MNPPLPAARQTGFTLVELLVVCVVIVVVLGAIVGQILSFQEAVAENTVIGASEATVRRALDRIIEEVRKADLTTMSVTTTTVSCAPIEGWNGTDFVVGSPVDIAFQDGDVSVNDVVIASGLNDVTFDLSGRLFTVVISIQKAAGRGAAENLVDRQLSARVKL